MMSGIVAAFAYGVLALVGGVIGYTQAASKVSLFSGLVSGLLLILGAFLWMQGSPAGAGLAVGVTVSLVIVFVRRWMQTGKAMPAVIMIVAGIGAFATMVSALAQVAQ